MKTFLKILLASSLAISASAKEIKLLNVSYDPTRELYTFSRNTTRRSQSTASAKTGDTVTISQSLHGGSGKQAQSVINGLETDRGHARFGLRH